MAFFNLTCCLNVLCSFDPYSHKYANLFCLSCVLMRIVIVSTVLMQTIFLFWGAYLISLWHMVSLNNWRFEANFILNYRSPTLTTVCNSYLKEKFWYLSLIKWWSSHFPHVTLTFVALWLRFQPLAPIWICMMALTLLASHTESCSRVPLSLSHSCQFRMIVLWR